MFLPALLHHILLLVLCSHLIECSSIRHPKHGRNAIELKLLKLAIILRHGDRSPYMTFPTNPYPPDDMKHWPDGPDQLTIGGKKRMFDVGRFIRQRYASFLSTCDPINVYARSSPADRCLNTASLVLASAFPPAGRLRFHPSLDWQPIPVHTEKDGLERMLTTPSRTPCPALKRAKELQTHADDVREYETNNTHLMKEISRHSGMPIVTLRDIGTVYDPLITAKEDGKRLPHWADEDFLKRMWHVGEKSFCVASSTPLIQRLETGLLWSEIRQKFTTDTGSQRVFLYSTHDTRMASFLKILNAYSGPPKYGTTLFFELLQNVTSGEQVVRVHFLEETWSHEVRHLSPTGCSWDKDCEVHAFFKNLQKFTIENDSFETECNKLPTDSQLTDCFTD